MTQGKGSELVLLQGETLISSPLHLQIELQHPWLGEAPTFCPHPVNSNSSVEVLSSLLFLKDTSGASTTASLFPAFAV